METASQNSLANSVLTYSFSSTRKEQKKLKGSGKNVQAQLLVRLPGKIFILVKDNDNDCDGDGNNEGSNIFSVFYLDTISLCGVCNTCPARQKDWML